MNSLSLFLNEWVLGFSVKLHGKQLISYKAPPLFPLDAKSRIVHHNMKGWLIFLLTFALIIKIVVTSVQKYDSISSQIIDFQWNYSQKYNFTGDKFGLHYYGILDGNRNNFNDDPLQQLNKSLCENMDAGVRAYGGFYKNQSLDIEQEELYFKMNCDLIDFGD